MKTEDWRARARCGGMDGRDGRPDFLEQSTARKKLLCGGCPVRFDCLSFALEAERNEASLIGAAHQAGIVYGGLDGRERQALIHRWRNQLNLAVIEARAESVA